MMSANRSRGQRRYNENKGDGHVESGHCLSSFNVNDSDGRLSSRTLAVSSLCSPEPQRPNDTVDSTFRQIPEAETTHQPA